MKTTLTIIAATIAISAGLYAAAQKMPATTPALDAVQGTAQNTATEAVVDGVTEKAAMKDRMMEKGKNKAMKMFMGPSGQSPLHLLLII